MSNSYVDYYGNIDRIIDKIFDPKDVPSPADSFSHKSSKEKPIVPMSKSSILSSDSAKSKYKSNKNWRESELNRANRAKLDEFMKEVFTPKELEDKQLIKDVYNNIDVLNLDKSKMNIKRLLRKRKESKMTDYTDKDISDIKIKHDGDIDLSKLF